jgi:hypothetical protein
MRLLAGGALIDTTGYTAGFTVRATAEGGQELFASVSNGKITVGYDPPKWTAATVYGLGQQVVPTTLNGYLYQVTTAGTSHATTEPTWPTTLGGTVVNNTVTFTNVGPDTDVTNLRIALTPTDTDSIEPWGVGLFDIQIIDTFSREYIVIEGDAVLRRAITRPAS